ncbi:AAA family ATPase [Paenibacillus apiarius]|nr:AAA family ATPase [Paenibacillus apiarius]
MNIKDICEDILRERKIKKKSMLIGIDGCGGAGKSTLASKLKNEFDSINIVSIVHMDDFYLPSKQRKEEIKDQNLIGRDFDWRRLLEQVLKPIYNGVEAYYQRYDWNQDKLIEWDKVPSGLVIIEGVYCLRSELYDYFDYTIWIETDYGTRLARGIERDGENMRDTWEEIWMPAEQQYVEVEKPYKKANLIIDGSGKGDHLTDYIRVVNKD